MERVACTSLLLVACAGAQETVPEVVGPGPTDTDPPRQLITDTGTHVTLCDEQPFPLSVLPAGGEHTVEHAAHGGWVIDIGGQVDWSGELVLVSSTITVPDLGDLQVGGDQTPWELALTDFVAEDSCLDGDDGRLDIGSGVFADLGVFVDDVSTPPTGGTYQEFICALPGPAVLTVTVQDHATGSLVTQSVDIALVADPVDGC